MKSAREAPSVMRLQYFNLPFRAFEVIRMLIGPAIGIEKMNPAINPTIDIVIKSSVNDSDYWIFKFSGSPLRAFTVSKII
jgi:hypothetical protein